MFDPEVTQQVKQEVAKQLGQPGGAIARTDATDIEGDTALDAVWLHWLDCATTMQTLGFSADALCEASRDIERVVERTRQEQEQLAERR